MFDSYLKGKKKISPMIMRSHLEASETDWTTWEYDVTIKVTIEQEKDEKSRQKSLEIGMKINLLQATLIHRDIQQVKLITNMARKKEQNILRYPSQIM